MDFEPSPQIERSQNAPHPRLDEIVRRHLCTEYQENIPAYAQQSFSAVQQWVNAQAKPIILDSGCGTGESSVILAGRYPHCSVIGIDKSAHRLGRGLDQPLPDNVLLVRNDCIHVWRLMHQQQWKIERHYILYPNPWPKPGHVQRRWHAHAVFPVLIKLGGQLIMRTNWAIYAQEFARALTLGHCGNSSRSCQPQRIDLSAAMTAHERKYLHSGHTVYEVQSVLGT